MRINLPLHPHHFAKQPAAGPSSGPLAQLGGDLVLVELQGELTWEGDKTNGVVGVIGLDRPDKPTLHLGPHHLLHGKFVTLQKPYAVIRKAIAIGAGAGTSRLTAGNALEGDASDEELDMDALDAPEAGPSSAKKRRAKDSSTKGSKASSKTTTVGQMQEGEDEDEDEPPLFAADPDIFPSTPVMERQAGSSSPFYPASAPRDYSSELDPGSSPARWGAEDDEEDEEDKDEEAKEAARIEKIRVEEKRRREKARAKRKRDEKERTRSYEVVGIVRKKLEVRLRADGRPEPIVTATVLPE